MAGDDDAEIRAMLERAGMRRYTDSTLVEVGALIEQIHEVRRRGFATDESEQAGVREHPGVVAGRAGVAAQGAGEVGGQRRRLGLDLVADLSRAGPRVDEAALEPVERQPQPDVLAGDVAHVPKRRCRAA